MDPTSGEADGERASVEEDNEKNVPPAGRWRALLLVAVAELLAMTLWFSVTAVAPELAVRWGLTSGETAVLTGAVQLGFVAGAVGSAVLTLSDTIRPRYLFAGSAFLGALATAIIAVVVESFLPAVALRFVTGIALAGVYPPGMKIMAGWFRAGRGFAIGVLIGALTLGSALPHLIRGAGGVGQPRFVLLGSAGLAILGGIIVLRVRPGPFQAPVAPFDPAAIVRIARDRATLLANLGYFGHMWELYAVWTWIPTYLVATHAVGGSEALASVLSFFTIGIGSVGAVVAGAIADRVGRTATTSASMAISGTASVLAGVAFDAPLVVLVPFLGVWGIAIIADSAQFSAAVSELAEDSYVGTALTLQTAIGFLLTVGSIQVTPAIADAVGWRWAFAPVVVGPLLGTVAMLALRRHPDATALADGRK